MVTSVGNGPQVQATAPAQPAQSLKKAVDSNPRSATSSSDHVQLSSSAQRALAALKEATETSAQTAQEAGAGDIQAQRLLAKETAEKNAK
jgi:hypothetical protein